MIINYTSDNSDQFYAHMIRALIPRPIAWVLTENPNGSFNLAPFSFFSGVSAEPPILMISVGWKDDIRKKDTWVNIEERSHFVVHIPSVDHGQAVVATSASLPLNVSEIDHAGMTTVPVEGMRLPRVAGPKVAFFCRKHKILEIGDEKQGMILGAIQAVWADDGVLKDRDGKRVIDARSVNPLTRLGGQEYGRLGEIFPLSRPK